MKNSLTTSKDHIIMLNSRQITLPTRSKPANFMSFEQFNHLLCGTLRTILRRPTNWITETANQFWSVRSRNTIIDSYDKHSSLWEELRGPVMVWWLVSTVCYVGVLSREHSGVRSYGNAEGLK